MLLVSGIKIMIIMDYHDEYESHKNSIIKTKARRICQVYKQIVTDKVVKNPY